jgi:hypothetical protein
MPTNDDEEMMKFSGRAAAPRAFVLTIARRATT